MQWPEVREPCHLSAWDQCSPVLTFGFCAGRLFSHWLFLQPSKWVGWVLSRWMLDVSGLWKETQTSRIVTHSTGEWLRCGRCFGPCPWKRCDMLPVAQPSSTLTRFYCLNLASSAVSSSVLGVIGDDRDIHWLPCLVPFRLLIPDHCNIVI